MRRGSRTLRRRRVSRREGSPWRGETASRMASRVRIRPKDMFEVAQGYVEQGHRAAVLNMAAKGHPGGGVRTGA
eukprot:15118926-Alexandrium_andersonii.AAC.1